MNQKHILLYLEAANRNVCCMIFLKTLISISDASIFRTLGSRQGSPSNDSDVNKNGQCSSSSVGGNHLKEESSGGVPAMQHVQHQQQHHQQHHHLEQNFPVCQLKIYLKQFQKSYSVFIVEHPLNNSQNLHFYFIYLWGIQESKLYQFKVKREGVTIFYFFISIL